MIKKNIKDTAANNKNLSITDDKMINEILGNIGKKAKNKNKKELINNFVNNTIGKSEKNEKSSNIIQKNNPQKKTHIQKSHNNNNSNNNSNDDSSNNSSNGSNGKKKTFTSNLTKEEINDKLQDYKMVEDISKVPLGTHLRYFVVKNGEKIFRMGGNLKRNLDLPKFVILENALGTQWSVQVKDTIFYKKMSLNEIKNEYDEIILELHEKIKKYKKKIEEKDSIIFELREIINKNKKIKK